MTDFRLVSATPVLAAILTLLAGRQFWFAELANAERPNLVIIYADDMGFGDLGVQNPDSKIATPHLDALARQGMRFTDAHSSSGICTPSRYALLTGRYHWRKMHGIVGAWGDSVFADERLTLPEMLKSQGYRTACIGKWHLGFDWSAIRKPSAKPVKSGRNLVYAADDFDWTQPIPSGPLAHGFDYYFGDDVPNFPPYTWIENDHVTTAPTIPYVPEPRPTEGAPEGRPGPMVEGWKQDAVMPRLTERAVAWIENQRNSDQPFFLYWPWTSPHAPIVPTTDWQGQTDVGGYGDFVAQSDHHAGEFLRALDENGFRENTIVIFTADNGPEKYAYDRIRNHEHYSSGPLRGGKRDIYEGGHRVPFLVRWPGVVEAGTITEGLMSQIDIMATMARIIGFELPDAAADDSHDQMELWMGGASARDSIVHNTKKDHYAVRRDNWVLIDAPSGYVSGVPDWFAEQEGFEKNPHQAALFDLSVDVGQRENLFAQETARVRELQDLLQQTRKAGEVRSR
ncbi:MAG: arylsulfatase [Planctomycetota bacterium]